MDRREYQYVGPPEIRHLARTRPPGVRISSMQALHDWLCSQPRERVRDGTLVATFAVNLRGELLLAPRRSEHVACASGGPVLSAGEITIDEDLSVAEITNLSTGFCPEPESWESVASALDQLGIQHPGRFTTEVVFRRCPACGERNIVKDDWFYCAVCEARLPAEWNFSRIDPLGEPGADSKPPPGAV